MPRPPLFVRIAVRPAFGGGDTVTMTAYDNSGNEIATKTLNISAYEKVVGMAPNLLRRA